jgi:hypothetical protein
MPCVLANSSLADPRHPLPTIADQLQRAAGTLRTHASSAHAVADRCVEDGPSVDEDALPPDARALRWHLGTTAEALRVSREACSASKRHETST